MRKRIEAVILHCSVSDFGDAKTIDQWHLHRGWKGIGYHKVILNGYRDPNGGYTREDDGKVESGRPLDDDLWIENNEKGAHTLGLNDSSIGVCLIGQNYRFTFLQMESLFGLLAEMMRTYHLDPDQVLGHYETASGKKQGKTCPQIPMEPFRFALHARQGWYGGN